MHNHTHTHTPGHHAPADYNRAFAIGIGLNVLLVLVQAVYGWLAGSLALLADAGHNLGDVMGLVLAWGAAILAGRIPTMRRTYGMRRASIYAAVVNGLVLMLASGAIALEAIRRFSEPQPVAGGLVAWVAGAGILVNAGTALLFMRGRATDLNIRGAFMHMASDAVVSLGVLVSALAIRYTGLMWLDPATSLLIVAVIVAGTWSLLHESLDLAMDAVPRNIDIEEVLSYLEDLPGVIEVHDLHVWAMSTTECALTAHLVRPDGTGDDALLARTCRDLHDRFGIEHATLQVEYGDAAHPCYLAPPHVV
jgi:cobalt-zinc-cadmium efflux system protein